MQTLDKHSIDTSLCPLCGQPNRCIMASANGDQDQECWCRQVSIPRALLEQVPDQARMRACICSSCVAKFNNKLKEGQ